MLKHEVSGSELMAPYFPSTAARLNESLLVPWKMLGLAVHVTGLLTVSDYREVLLSASVPLDVDPADLALERHSTNVALAVTYFCVFVSGFALISARTITFAPVNLLSAAGHSVAGILLLEIWLEKAHVVRIWHTFFVFTLGPALLEFTVIVLRRVRGDFMW